MHLGSFRGVPFFTEQTEREGGRHAAIHEFPFSEQPPYTEDLGRQGRRFVVECFTLGDDYDTARDALISALEAPGPGELVHPFFGTRRVQVDGTFRVREQRDPSGIAQFSIPFVETLVSAPAPLDTPNLAAAVQSSAAAVTAASGDRFASAYKRFSALRESVTLQIRSVTRAINRTLDRVSIEAQAAASLRAQLDDLSTSAVGLANAPGDLLLGVVNVFQGLGAALAATPLGNPSAAMLGLYAFDPGPRPPATTPSRIVEQGNFDALQNLIRRQVLVQSATLAIGQTFASYDDAVAARSAIIAALDDHLEVVTDDVFPSLAQLRADLVRAVPGDSRDLPRLQRYTPPITVPSLVLSYRLFGDVSGEQDIVERNRIANPGFVAGGVELEILTREG